MPVNLANLNISLEQFQRIASGTYNAGEVKLKSATRLGKMNNHVYSTGRNNERISHSETLAIKAAFVKALSENGVDAQEIQRIRKDLGLMAQGETDRKLRERSVRPLSRQQVREILDRNAAAINGFNAGNQNAGRVRTSQEIYGAQGMSERNTRMRDAVNNVLASGTRQFLEESDISYVQAICANNTDYRPLEDRQGILSVARALLDKIMQNSRMHPRENEPAKVEIRLQGGRAMPLDAGMSEAAFAERLHDIIARLDGPRTPAAKEQPVRTAFRQTPENAKGPWIDALAADPDGGWKARVIAVRMMQDRGVTDPETLALPNRLSNADAIRLARRLNALPPDAAGAAVRQDPEIAALADKAPQELPDEAKAYVPATSNKDYNNYVRGKLRTGSLGEFPEFRAMVLETSQAMRLRYGEKGMPGDSKLTMLVDANKLKRLFDELDAKGERATPDNLRDKFMRIAAEKAAARVIESVCEKAYSAAGGHGSVTTVVNSFKALNPAIAERLNNSQSPAETDAILAEAADKVRKSANLYIMSATAAKSVDGKVRAAIAGKLGLPPENLGPGNFQTNYLKTMADRLADDITLGRVKAETQEEIQTLFDKLADDFASERARILEKVDSCDFSPVTKDSIKTLLLTVEKVKNLDIDKIIAEASQIDVSGLLAALKAGAGKHEIYQAMKPVSDAVGGAIARLFDGANDVGPDDFMPVEILMMFIVAGKNPGLDVRLESFFAREDVKDEVFGLEGPQSHARIFTQFRSSPEDNAAIAASLGTPSLPPVYALSIIEGCRSAGFEKESPAELLAMFEAGKPAGVKLADALNTSPVGISAQFMRGIVMSIVRPPAGGQAQAQQNH